MHEEKINKVNIRPGVSVLSVLRYLNYKPWFALAEFVDNSLQSYIANKTALKNLHDGGFRCIVRIDVDTTAPASIKIRDNAAGIAFADFPRAFRPAEAPPDHEGLSEFGMGMKSAACWFAPRWKARTLALGESIERTIEFDIKKIVEDRLEELVIQEKESHSKNSFTEIVLYDLYNTPAGRTIGKLKEHLTDIYRAFIRAETLELYLNGEKLVYEEPKILQVSFFKDPQGQEKLWRKDIKFDFGEGMHVSGFAAIREKANISRSGFSLFRRARLIEGSGDQGYRPESIFGKSNSFRYQRIFGELHLTGFDISHTKDGFRWDENEAPFLQLLKEHLDENDMPLLTQAEGHRARPAKAKLRARAEKAAESTAQDMEKNLPSVLPEIADKSPEDTSDKPLPKKELLTYRKFEFTFQEQKWSVAIEITEDPAEGDWLSITNQELNLENRRIQIRLAATHPFMIRFAQRDEETMEALLRVAAAMAIAEVLFKSASSKLPGSIRRTVNEILRDVFSNNI